MKQFMEVEIKSCQYNGNDTTKIVVNVNHIIAVVDNSLYVTTIHPVAHGTGQVIYDLAYRESERIKELLLNND